ncbi:hypothetical protein Lste_0062 [Legionella steelei]|nr:hypothetical protein Lste_0062 [Legionella steelei]
MRALNAIFLNRSRVIILKSNRPTRAKWHGCRLVGTMLNSIIDDEEHYMLLPQSEYEQLSQYSFEKVHEYFDENEPLGGWWDPKSIRSGNLISTAPLRLLSH